MTPIDLETRKAIVELILLFRILKRQETLSFNKSLDLLYGESPAPKKRRNLSPAAIERLVTVYTKIQSLDNCKLEQFFKLYNLAKGRLLKAL